MSFPGRRTLDQWLNRLYAGTGSRDDIDDDLLRHLVASVYGAPAPLYASMTMGLTLSLACIALTGHYLFYLISAAHVVVCAVRVFMLWQYARAGGERADRAATLSFDAKFTFWGSLFALLLGLTFYAVMDVGEFVVSLPIAVGGAVGFPISFVTRHSGRPRLVCVQIAAVITPVMVAYLTMPIPFGRVFALLLFGVAVSALVLARHSYAQIVEHYRIDSANRRLAQFDALTGLLNRHALNQALAVAVGDPERANPHPFALICVDLDRFKEINDTAGHDIGDKVLVETARRLSAVAQPDYAVARLGGDEFMMIAPCPHRDVCAPDKAALAQFAETIVETLGQPIVIEGLELPMSASVGVAVFPDQGRDPAELMKRSDIALYDAKRAGRGRFTIFDNAMQARLDNARALEIDLARAVREDQFEAWFQPIYDFETDRPLGYEALARWRHPERGLISPELFIPLAEQNGAIVDIGQAMLEKACAAASRWDSELTVAVNLSPVEFRRPKELVARITETLARTGLAPGRLYIEITESLMLEDTAQTRAAVRQLANFGVRFSLDDFGAGYSSLSYIQDYPFSKIKIDRKFVDRIDSDPVSSAIIASVCVLAERTRMEIVAEGVETQLQEHALRRLGIRHAQGYLYGRPNPAALANELPRLKLLAS